MRLGGALAALAVTALALLLGCASPGIQRPPTQPLAGTQLGIEPTAEPAPRLAADWWRGFGDPALDSLVERALAGHPSLQLAQARLLKLQAGLDAASAASGPQLNGTLEATRQRFSANAQAPPPLGGSVRTLATAQLDASWEIDFFGRHRAALDAALGSARAAQADLAAARLLLASSVVRSWVQLGRLGDQRGLAQRAVQQRTELLALLRQREQAGLDTRLDLLQGEAALPEARQQLEQVDEQITLVRHALAALSAQPPEALAALPGPRGPSWALPLPLSLALPAALPADLLGRRADIAAARWRVEAASGEWQGARALFYPNINLRAFVGLTSFGLDRLLRAGSEQVGVGPALHLPLFDAGRLRANLQAKAAEVDAAVASYNTAVLEAVRDVADQLGTLASLARQQQDQALAQAAAEAVHEMAGQRFGAGLGNRLGVLNAEAAVLQQRRLAVELRARLLDTQLLLIRTLGGGYDAGAGL